jgi:hypothetical protein
LVLKRVPSFRIRHRKLFIDIIVENFPNLGKDVDIQEQKALGAPNRHSQK